MFSGRRRSRILGARGWHILGGDSADLSCGGEGAGLTGKELAALIKSECSGWYGYLASFVVLPPAEADIKLLDLALELANSCREVGGPLFKIGPTGFQRCGQPVQRRAFTDPVQIGGFTC